MIHEMFDINDAEFDAKLQEYRAEQVEMDRLARHHLPRNEWTEEEDQRALYEAERYRDYLSYK